MTSEAHTNPHEPSASLVACRDVGFRYESTHDSFDDPTLVAALEGVELEAAPGSVTVLCGASGSGKSTILRVLSGLIPHFDAGERTGTVMVDGEDPADRPLEASGLHVSTVLQHPRTQFFTTLAQDEVAFALQNYEVPRPRILDAVDSALGEMDIEALRIRELCGLSGGQLQKVACAQVLAQNVPVVLLDEPTSNLDAASVARVRRIISQLRDAGKAVIIAEHRLAFVADLADRIVLVEHGRIAHNFSAAQWRALSEADRGKLGLRSATLPQITRASATPPASASTLELRQVRVNAGRRCLLHLDHAEFSSGVVNVVVGSNGAGKTTLLRAIAGLGKRARGSSVRLGGRRLRLGDAFLVMQEVHRQLFCSHVIDEAPQRFLEQLDLADMAQRHPLSLSGGQQQRLVIATALASDSEVLLFDEPTSGVDARHLGRITSLLRSAADAGRVVIVVTHDPEFIAECADAVYELSNTEAGTSLRAISRQEALRISARATAPGTQR